MTIDQLKTQVKDIVETHPRGVRWFIGLDEDQNPRGTEAYPYGWMTPVRNNPALNPTSLTDSYVFDLGCFDIGRVAPAFQEKDDMLSEMYNILFTMIVELYSRGQEGVVMDGNDVEWNITSSPIEPFQDDGPDNLFGYAATITLTSNNSFDLCCNDALFS